MLVKFPVWEYHNTQLGFSLQLNSNTKKGLLIRKNRKSFFVFMELLFHSPFFDGIVVIQITNSQQLTTHDVGDRNDPMDAISEIYPFPM